MTAKKKQVCTSTVLDSVCDELNPKVGPDDNVIQVFQQVQGTKVCCSTHRYWCCDISNSALPWCGPAHFLTLEIGSGVVIVMDSDLVQAAGGDLMGYITRGGSGLLKRSPSFYCQGSASFWVPFGCVPLVVGCDFTSDLPDGKKDTKKKGDLDNRFLTTLSRLVCDKRDLEESVEKRLGVAASLLQRKTFLPQSLKKHDDYLAWVGQLSADQPQGDKAKEDEPPQDDNA